ncbi:MAG: MarR family transcriptional regulator [Bacilli bacterium]|nr:MarR family transcriptional regulator [Bacilli bacterium]
MSDKKPIGVEIRTTSNMIKCYIDQILSERLDFGLTGIEGMILSYIFRLEDKGIVTARDVMKSSKASKSTTSQSLTGLEKKGFITMGPSEEDKRVKIIQLTERGREAQAECRYVFQDIRKVISQGITEEEENLLREMLEKIQKNISRKEEES